MIRIGADTRHPIKFLLDGETVLGDATPRMLLTDFLRDVVGSTAVRVGCEHGVCGACTVGIDGELARACLKFAVQVNGREISTAAGLAQPDGRLALLQETLKEKHALQCGFCASGILMTLDHYIALGGVADEEAIRDVLSGHLCRCTGYSAMVEAALELAVPKGRSRSESEDD